MCGIVGVCNLNGESVDEALLRRMTNRMAHRGPDGEGYFTDGPIGLGHRRLAIIDLTEAGRQPIANETGDIVASYNGEIYNFQQLRVELEAAGHRFHSNTDSEVVVHAYEQWGEDCVHRFNGMFAFALWDRVERRLFLARDRYGIKPLYWYCRGGVFLFASEIKALLSHPRVSVSVCSQALDEYFTFQNIFTDRTLFEGIRLVPPGCCLTLDLRNERGPVIRRFWDFPPPNAAVDLDDGEAAQQVGYLFQQAVTRQLVSDVPVGGYLSGGMDSGSIVAVAVRHLSRLTTFTGGFDLTSASGLERGFDERRNAEMLANQFKTEHYEVVLHAGDMEHVLPTLTWHLEDLRVGQCYPNYYVARLASRFVKVVLSGAGGDELFAGYPWRYYQGMDSGSSDEYFQRYYSYWQRLVSDDDKVHLFNARTRSAINGHSTLDVFRGVFDSWDAPLETADDYLAASLYFELKTFLHGLLVVEDKLSMANSLETRVPFLDNDLVDFAMGISARHKLGPASAVAVDENDPGKRLLYGLQTNSGKAVLRRAMQPFIPREVAARTKQGFSAPDASWFRGESIDYINRLLRDPRARLYEFIEPAYVARVLDEHCSGRINRRLLIWSFISFEWWCRTFLTGDWDAAGAGIDVQRREFPPVVSA